jgi:hypothetical protein
MGGGVMTGNRFYYLVRYDQFTDTFELETAGIVANLGDLDVNMITPLIPEEFVKPSAPLDTRVNEAAKALIAKAVSTIHLEEPEVI